MYTTSCRRRMNEPLFTDFFSAAIVAKMVSNIFLKNNEKIFLIDIMTYNKHKIKETFQEVWYNENASMKFLWIFLSCSFIRKYVKIRFKNRGSPCYFLSSKGQKIKDITKIGQKRLFLFTFLVSFFMAFLAQKLIYTINIWFNFVFDSIFEQDNLLNLFISGVSAKRWPKCARISIQKVL